MNKKTYIFIFIIIVLAVVLSACSAAATATSWPGLKVSDNLAYVAFGNYLYAVKMADGTMAWKFPQTEDKTQFFFPAAALENNTLVVGNYANQLYSIDATTGEQKWVYKDAKDKFFGSPLLINGITYAPNADGHLYTLGSDGKLLWEFKTEKQNWSKPVTDDTNLYFASMDHFVYALKLNYTLDEISADEFGKRDAILKPLWKVDLGTAAFSDPVLSSKGVLYVGTLGGKIFAINTQNGEILWSYPKTGELGGIWFSVVLVDDVVFVADDSGMIHGLSASTGTELWSNSYDASAPNTTAPIIGGGTALAGNAAFVITNGKFIVLNTQGSLVWSKDFNESLYTAPQVINGRLVLAAVGSDYLLTYFDQNSQFWSFNPPK